MRRLTLASLLGIGLFGLFLSCTSDGGFRLAGSVAAVEQLAALPPVPQQPGRGTLILDGGGRSSPAVFDLIVAYAGNSKPRLCLIDTAMDGEGDPKDFFQGYRGVKLLDLNLDEEDVEDPGMLATLRRCTGFFFNGGDPDRLSKVFRPDGRDSSALAVIRERFERHGAVVSGSSAGAMIAGPLTLCECSERSSVLALTEGQLFQAPGFGMLEGVLLDAHFFANGLLGRHLFALARNGIAVGVGIDEGAAVLVPAGGAWQVVGEGAVALIRTPASASPGNLLGFGLDLLLPGDSFDPYTGEVRVAPGRAPFVVASIAADEPLAADDIFRPGRLRKLLARLAQEPAAALVGTAADGRIRVTVRETPQTLTYGDGVDSSITGLQVSIERDL